MCHRGIVNCSLFQQNHRKVLAWKTQVGHSVESGGDLRHFHIKHIASITPSAKRDRSLVQSASAAEKARSSQLISSNCYTPSAVASVSLPVMGNIKSQFDSSINKWTIADPSLSPEMVPYVQCCSCERARTMNDVKNFILLTRLYVDDMSDSDEMLITRHTHTHSGYFNIDKLLYTLIRILQGGPLSKKIVLNS